MLILSQLIIESDYTKTDHSTNTINSLLQRAPLVPSNFRTYEIKDQDENT